MTIFRRSLSRPVILVDRAQSYQGQATHLHFRFRIKGSGESEGGGGSSAPAFASALPLVRSSAQPLSGEASSGEAQTPPVRTTSETDFLAGVGREWMPLVARAYRASVRSGVERRP